MDERDQIKRRAEEIADYTRTLAEASTLMLECLGQIARESSDPWAQSMAHEALEEVTQPLGRRFA